MLRAPVCPRSPAIWIESSGALGPGSRGFGWQSSPGKSPRVPTGARDDAGSRTWYAHPAARGIHGQARPPPVTAHALDSFAPRHKQKLEAGSRRLDISPEVQFF